MDDRGKSDRPVVPEKSPNKVRGAPGVAEEMEGRGLANGSPREQTRDRAQIRSTLQHALDRVRQAAHQDRELRFTTLWHHVYDVQRLCEAYFGLERCASPGVDGETWEHYGEELATKLADLSDRLERGAYRARPVRRARIPKPDGGERLIGIPALEDKLVQKATSDVIGAVYETDFRGFSYGFRPGRSPHDALDALTVGIERKMVNWVLDADILGFFDTIDHEWLLKFVEHRIADQRVHRHVRKWLKAGVLEKDRWSSTEMGTPQGGSISPLLANIYLHYVLDLWADAWRRRQARGDMIIVRYADDFVLGFQHRHEAERFQTDLTERLRKFGLELHPQKTRLIEFGRFAEANRRDRGVGKPPTFDFLGFTHYCGRTRRGGFRVGRRTMSKRLRKKLTEVRRGLRLRMHHSIPSVGSWLRSVVVGHNLYYGVPGNYQAICSFRSEIIRSWRLVIARRSHKARCHWSRMWQLAEHWLPWPRITHPYPDQRLRVSTGGKSPVR